MTSFEPCVIIPIYNHKDTIVTTVADIQRYHIHIIIIDDGSDLETKVVLKEIESLSQVSLFSLASNQGKGAACILGLKMAEQQGFTHALQIDADGQHDIDDIPKFLAAAKAKKDAIVCGQPIYDDSILKVRKFSRSITHFWVAIETLTLKPIDSMCGFRFYPVVKTNQVINQNPRLGRRMNFDTEILVRLIWQNIPTVLIKTKVIYLPNGLSHFDYVRDNILITKMHTKLFFGMLIRLPQLLSYKMKRQPQQHWSNISEKGHVTGIRLLLYIYKILGRNALKLVLLPVMSYYFITSTRARKASSNYLQKIYHTGTNHSDFQKSPGLKQSYQHFLTFSFAILDKISAWIGDIQRHDIIFEKEKEILDLQASGQGAVILSAHLGNIEAVRALPAKHVKMTALVFTKNAMKFNKVFHRLSSRVTQHLLQVDTITPDTIIMLKQKIDQGEFIIILADRTAINSTGRISRCQFLGQEADFGQGPFILASLLNCPVYLMFNLKVKQTYHIFLEKFADTINLPPKNKEATLAIYVQTFAKRLEYYCLKYPYQWFNFYDFWGDIEKR